MSSSSISCHQLENERQLLPGRELVVSLSGSILTPRMAARPRTGLFRDLFNPSSGWSSICARHVSVRDARSRSRGLDWRSRRRKKEEVSPGHNQIWRPWVSIQQGRWYWGAGQRTIIPTKHKVSQNQGSGGWSNYLRCLKFINDSPSRIINLSPTLLIAGCDEEPRLSFQLDEDVLCWYLFECS